VASTLPVAGLAATAAPAAIRLQPRDAVLIGAAGGGVEMFAFQLAQLAGARVTGTCSQDTYALLRQVSVQPAQYGPGARRPRARASPEWCERGD
jgi:NADPH:quinone reductase-like Zn-dependent oxidoreductase